MNVLSHHMDSNERSTKAKVEIVEAEDVTLVGTINLDLGNLNPSCRVLTVDQNRTIIVVDHESASEILHNHAMQYF